MQFKVPVSASSVVISTDLVNENNDYIPHLQVGGTNNEVDTDIGSFTECNRLVDLYICIRSDMFERSLLQYYLFWIKCWNRHDPCYLRNSSETKTSPSIHTAN